MSTEQFANNAQTTLTAPIDNATTTVPVANGMSPPFPGSAQFRILIDSEIMLVTGGAGTNSWTVVRGQEGTTAAAHAVNATVTQVLTAGGLENLDASYITTGKLALARGGTNGDLSGTGGSNQFVKQSTPGAALSVGTIGAADISSALSGTSAGGDLSGTYPNPTVKNFVAAGASHAHGAVPDPGATAHTPPYYLGDDAAWHVAQPALNYILNGGGDFFQRNGPSATAVANGGYGPDRYYLLGDSGATDIKSGRVSGTGSVNAIQITNGNAAAKHTGMAQIVEGINSVALRGQTVSLQVTLNTGTGSRNMRIAILEWTGAIDQVNFGGTVGRDPVSNWSSTTYTAGNFFRNTNLTVDAVSGSLTPGTTPTTYTLSATISNSCNNIVVMIWEEAASPASGTWTAQQIGLYPANTQQAWLTRPVQQELALCQRYYCKSYDPDTAPGTVTGSGVVCSVMGTNSIVAGQRYNSVRFPVVMRGTPMMSYYGESGTPGTVSNNVGTDLAANSCTTADQSTSGFDAYNNSGGTITTTVILVLYHYTANAEL